MTVETILIGVSAIAELLVAGVLYYEFEGGRLDRFLEDAGSLSQSRKRNIIYEAYCGLSPGGTPRNQAFKDHLDNADPKLREACDATIRVISRIGARLPWIPNLRSTALNWHVVVLLWVILGPYIEQRRKESGPTYAESFLEYALASLERLLAQKQERWIIRDPDRSRKQDVCVTREQMMQMKEQMEMLRTGAV